MIQAQRRRARRKIAERWETVKWEDWPSDSRLAKVMKTQPCTCRYWRMKLAPHTLRSRDSQAAKRKEILDSLDWSLSNHRLAEQTGLTPNCISWSRWKYNKPWASLKNRERTKAAERWDSVDWSLKDQELSDLLGITRDAVNKARHKYAPHTCKGRWPQKELA